MLGAVSTDTVSPSSIQKFSPRLPTKNLRKFSEAGDRILRRMPGDSSNMVGRGVKESINELDSGEKKDSDVPYQEPDSTKSSRQRVHTAQACENTLRTGSRSPTIPA